jgi:predicted DNA-binding transcriptional regulator AlpA
MERDYYTAREAIAKLGLSKTEFHRRASQGRIPKFTPTGKKQSVYPKAEIDALARSMSMLFELHDRFIFSKSTIAEQEQEMVIGIRCFGREFITPLPERIAFQQKSEFTFWSLKVESRVVGYISMFRFPPDFLDDLLTGRRIERDITIKEVLPFARLEPFNVYIDVLAMDPTIETELRHWYAGILMSRFADTVLNLLGNGYFIRAFYTVTASPEGDRVVRHAGFRLMPNKSIVPGRTAYEFPVDDVGMQKLREISRREIYHVHGRAEDSRDT